MVTVDHRASTMLDVALDALAHDLAVVPPAQDGTKRPDGRWKTYQERLPTEDEVRSWYTAGERTGIGLITGHVSGNLEMLEFEGRAMEENIGDLFADRAAVAGLTELVDRINTGYCETTPTGGLHLLYRVEGAVAGNTKLARRPATAAELAQDPLDKVRVLIETRGEGGYVVIAPSHGTVHATGNEWVLLNGGFDTIATITADERDQLHAVARTLDTLPVAPPAPASPVARMSAPLQQLGDDERPGDAYNNATDAAHQTLQLLERHGWTAVHHQAHDGHDDIHLRRPGKQIGTSAVLHMDAGTLVVFSTSTPFNTEEAYSPFAVRATLEHGGDYQAAARHLRPAGQHDDLSWARLGRIDASSSEATIDPETGEIIEADPGLTVGYSWKRTNLADVVTGIVDGTIDRPQPIIGRYTSGPEGALWYPARVNGLYGEPGKGKTMICVAVAAQVLNDGDSVAWIDIEEPVAGIVQRLLDLGARPDAIIDRFAHYAPEEPISHAHELLAELEDLAPALVVIDSTGEALALEGAKPNNDDEVASWFQRWPRRIANRTGAAVVVIDHVVKDETTRGLWPGGSQRKKAAINGSAFMVTPIKELGRGVDGRLKLTTSKDRSGHHRTATKACEFILDADGCWQLEGAAPTTDAPFRPTHLMEAVSRYLQMQSEPVGKNTIEKDVSGQGKAIRTAVDILVAEGYVRRTQQGQKSLHEHIKPYIEALDIAGLSSITGGSDR